MPFTPTQRTTRSGSNTSSVNLNDIKALIESSREDTQSLKVEIEKFGKMFELVFKRLDDALKQNEALTSRVKELEDTVKNLSGQSNEGAGSLHNDDVIGEMEERHRRRKFIIISGLQEPSTGSPDERALQDKDEVKLLAHKVGVENLEVEKITRIGPAHSRTPRLVRFKCSSMEMKYSLLRAARHLRKYEQYEKVFVKPDLTKSQRMKDKELRTELGIRRRAGEHVVIRSGRIVDSNNYDSYSKHARYFL